MSEKRDHKEYTKYYKLSDSENRTHKNLGDVDKHV